MTVRANLVAGAEYQRDANGERIILTYGVQNLTGAPESRALAAAEASGIPRYNSPHPSKPQLRSLQYRAVPMQGQPNTFVVTVTYLNPDEAGGDDVEGDTRVSMTTEVISEVTTRDLKNNALRTVYVRWNLNARSTDTLTHRVTVEKPTFGLAIERTESGIAFEKATRFAGFTNSRPWQGKPASTWLMRVRSNQLDNGLHRVTYDAVYNPETWQAVLIHTVNGVVPSPVPKAGNGIERYDVYPVRDYNQLALPRYLR